MNTRYCRLFERKNETHTEFIFITTKITVRTFLFTFEQLLRVWRISRTGYLERILIINSKILFCSKSFITKRMPIVLQRLPGQFRIMVDAMNSKDVKEEQCWVSYFQSLSCDVSRAVSRGKLGWTRALVHSTKFVPRRLLTRILECARFCSSISLARGLQ